MHVPEIRYQSAHSKEVRCLFFDAVGTLIYPARSVGETYSQIGEQFGFQAYAETLDAAFRQVFRVTDPPMPVQDDRDWWRTLVEATFVQAEVSGASGSGFDSCFDALFGYYAEGAAWRVYVEVDQVLRDMKGRGLDLWVLSNFDGRLVSILEDLGLAKYFQGIVYSSDVGFSKPAPEIFAEAVRRSGYPVSACLHIGDDPEADWQGGASAGLAVYRLDRSIGDLTGLSEPWAKKT